MEKILKINNKEYYLADDIYKMEPESFVGCSKTSRLIVTNKKLKQNDYIYMKYIKSKNEWVVSEESYKQAKLLITKEWVASNLIKFKKEKTEEDIKIESMKAPSILELIDDEKFVDINGEILDIEVRGSRDIDNIFFKVKDVGILFKLGDVKTVLLNKDSSFQAQLHYKLFKGIKLNNPDSNTNKKGNQKVLFLTFKGLTKLLYVSQSKNAEHFQDWANKLLFTHKLGTKEDKKKLVNKLLGCDIDESRRTINCSSTKISSIYLLTLGYVKDLRKTFNIDEKFNDDNIVVKYGRTDDLSRRLKEHQDNYNKLENVNVMLKLYSYVDDKLVSQAETAVKRFFQWGKYNIDNEEYKELVVIPINDFETVKKEYELIKNNYGGDSREYIYKINMIELEFQNKLIKLEKENLELKNKFYELLLKTNNIHSSM